MSAVTTYDLSLFAHILVVVYLLGADLGRLHLARVAAATGATPAARLAAARAALWLGSVTNAALLLILPAGVSLGSSLGVFRVVSETWYVATWVVSAGWLALSIAADRSAAVNGPGGAWPRADLVFRLLMGAGQVYDGVIALAGTNVSVDARWLGVKILVFGLLILLSIPVRHAGFGLRRHATRLAADAADAQAAEGVGRASARLPVLLVAGWLLILVAAWMGAAKPF